MTSMVVVVSGCSDADPAITTSTAPEASTTAETDTAVQIPDEAGLAESGPFGLGVTVFQMADPNRDDRPIRIVVYYPAHNDDLRPLRDADPDTTAAPYPVIVGDEKIVGTLGTHLASHGFVVAGGMGMSSHGPLDPVEIDYPLDLSVALDHLAGLTDHPLGGLVDTDRAGVVGYSFGSWISLAMAGIRVNPAQIAATCADPPDGWDSRAVFETCDQERWELFSARAAEVGIVTDDGPWDGVGDDRIRAAMPMGARGFSVAGPEGIADIGIPLLFVAGGDDEPRVEESRPIIQRVDDAHLIIVPQQDHMMIFDEDVVAQLKRFSLAFFGLHLLNEPGFASYLTKEFVEGQASDLDDIGPVLQWEGS